MGVMWRNGTADLDGDTAQEWEDRQCGGWTQWYFDEANISAGNFSKVYCHVWVGDGTSNLFNTSEIYSYNISGPDTVYIYQNEKP